MLILSEIRREMHFKMSFAKYQQICSSLDGLRTHNSKYDKRRWEKSYKQSIANGWHDHHSIQVRVVVVEKSVTMRWGGMRSLHTPQLRRWDKACTQLPCGSTSAQWLEHLWMHAAYLRDAGKAWHQYFIMFMEYWWNVYSKPVKVVCPDCM